MNYTVNNIIYTDRFSSNAKLIEFVKPKEGQTYEFISQDELDKRIYTLSVRNAAGAYILPTEKDQVYINFIPQKVFVSDLNLAENMDTKFSYFVPPVVVAPDAFTLPDGQIFRCVSPDSTPTSKEGYTYYIMEQGQKKQIPNYKTLEVMLAERNQTLLSVRVIPESECSQIPQDSMPIPDKQDVWNESFEDQTNFEKLKALDANVKSGAAIADAATKSADQQIAAVKAAEEKAKAEADAAKAQSQADKAASDAAKAQAAAAQAAAEQAKAEADAKKAELDLQLQNQTT